MNHFYQKDKITIYCGKAEEIVPHLPKHGLIVLDPPYTVSFANAMEWLMNRCEDGGHVLMLTSRGYHLIPSRAQSPSEHCEMAELAAKPEFTHHAARPVPVMRSLLALTEGSILDPYMGVGSSLIAAKALGREAVGIEQCKSWCQITVERLEGN